jgi:hypothetical protein
MEKQNLSFTGRLSEIKEVKTGEGQKGEWAAIDFEVTEDSAEYPQIALFSMFKNGEHIKFAKDFNNFYKEGDIIKVEFNFDKSVYTKKDGSGKGVFYKNSAWKITKIMDAFPVNEASDLIPEDDKQDLPFIVTILLTIGSMVSFMI